MAHTRMGARARDDRTTSAGPSSSSGSGTPPDWFHQAQQEQGERARLEQLRVDRDQAQRLQAERARGEREQAQRDAVARVNGTRHPPRPNVTPGREVRGPVRQNATPWIGAPPGRCSLPPRTRRC